MSNPSTLVITTAAEMSTFSRQKKVAGETVGFVPTMGALHEGHMALVRESRKNNDVTVVSVFVNPTQFNEPSDLDSYPRTFEADLKLLSEVGADVMFFPNALEIYPTNETKMYEMDGLDLMMEGPNRPGHFNGVVQVVTRLFDIVIPDSAYFGEKDFQQLTIVKYMSDKLGYATKIVGCPTKREVSGLAMSSRNVRLSESGKERAIAISRSLKEIGSHLAEQDSALDLVLYDARKSLSESEGLELEYLELVDPVTLAQATNDSLQIQACVAAWIEGVRLIDNMQVK